MIRLINHTEEIRNTFLIEDVEGSNGNKLEVQCVNNCITKIRYIPVGDRPQQGFVLDLHSYPEFEILLQDFLKRKMEGKLYESS